MFCIIKYLNSLSILFFKKNKNEIILKKYVILLSGSLIILWPLTTTGNFFNNYNSSFVFLHLSLFLYITNEFKIKFKN